MAVKTDALKKAHATLEQAIELYEKKKGDPELQLALQDSIIQRFEYTYELAWKTIQRWLAENVTPEIAEPVYSRKDLFRLAAKSNIITNPEQWFVYHQARNVSAHTYHDKNAKRVLEAALGLNHDCKTLIATLDKFHD